MKKSLHIICITVFLAVLHPAAEAQYYNTLNDVFTSTSISSSFGFNEGYKPKNALTRYQIVAPTNTNTDDLTQAWFDVGNNNITCSINANGMVEYPSVMGPLWYQVGLNSTDYVTGGQWTFSINDGTQTASLASLPNPALDIVDNFLYKWRYTFNNLKIQLLYFAPEKDESPLVLQPRALIAVVNITNTGTSNVNGNISPLNSITDAYKIDATLKKAVLFGAAATPVANNHKGSTANFHPKYAEVAPTVAGYEAVMLLDPTLLTSTFPKVSFSLKPGENLNIPFAFLVGGGYDELKFTRDSVAKKPVLDWLNSTTSIHKKPTGNLSIPDDPMLAEMFYRYYECGQTCYLLNGSGTLSEPKGGSYSIMSLLNPGYLKQSVQSLTTIAQASISYSLYSSTLLLIMAADYYQRSGDSITIRNKTFQTNATATINNILATQYTNGVTLFPSTKIWDGPSRGDYHTGSQILVWRVLDVFSRIARKEWNDVTSADTWTQKAAACKADILSKCVISGTLGTQFAEGTWKSGLVDNKAKSHDGEEVALVQSAFYGLVEQDNPLVTNHCATSMTAFNPLYLKALNSMQWTDASGMPFGSTFPAWLVTIAGATTNEALLSGFNIFKTMTDVDGSPWWWPYDVIQSNPAVVNRRKCIYNTSGLFCDVAKVPYATSVFNTLLINNILGLAADVPQKKVSFRPFSPWNGFEWKNGRIGNALFDIKYTDNGSSITAEITNRNTNVYTGTIGITAPVNKTIVNNTSGKTRYGRDYMEFVKQLIPNQTETITIQYGSPNAIESVFSNSKESVFSNLSAYPNPFSDKTTITADLNKPNTNIALQLTIFNNIGKIIRIIKNTANTSGEKLPPIIWDGKGDNGHKVESGLYFYTLKAVTEEGQMTVSSSKIMVIK